MAAAATPSHFETESTMDIRCKDSLMHLSLAAFCLSYDCKEVQLLREISLIHYPHYLIIE